MFETEHYEVKLAKFVDPVLNEEVDGYGVFNKETGVREAETRRFHTARMFCKRFQDDDEEESKIMADKDLERLEGFNA
jgi:hypothetical protein